MICLCRRQEAAKDTETHQGPVDQGRQARAVTLLNTLRSVMMYSARRLRRSAADAADAERAESLESPIRDLRRTFMASSLQCCNAAMLQGV